MTSVTSAMWASDALRWASFDSSTTASVLSSNRRSRRANLRSAYCRTRSGTSRFLPLTIVLTAHLPARTRHLAAGATGRRTGPAGSPSIDGNGGSAARRRVRATPPTRARHVRHRSRRPTASGPRAGRRARRRRRSARHGAAVGIPSQKATMPMSDTTAPARAIGRHHSCVSSETGRGRRRTGSSMRPRRSPRPRGRCRRRRSRPRSHEPPDLVGPAGEAEGRGEEQDVADAVGDQDDGEADAQDSGDIANPPRGAVSRDPTSVGRPAPRATGPDRSHASGPAVIDIDDGGLIARSPPRSRSPPAHPRRAAPRAAALSVAPVVTTSSTSTTQRPATARRASARTDERLGDVRRPMAPIEVVLRGRGPRSARAPATHGSGSAAPAAAAISSAWS